MDRRLPGFSSGESGREDSSAALSRILSLLGLPHSIDVAGPVRDALVVQAYRLSRPGRERDALDHALLALVTLQDSRLLLPLRGVRLCRALRIPECRRAEETARRTGILTFHSDDVLNRAGEELLRAIDRLIGTPRRATKTFGRVLKLFPRPKLGAVDAPTLRLIRRLATGVRARRRGQRDR